MAEAGQALAVLDGSLWLANESRLFRYDMQSWQAEETPNATGLRIDELSVVDGALYWLGDDGAGVIDPTAKTVTSLGDPSTVGGFASRLQVAGDHLYFLVSPGGLSGDTVGRIPKSGGAAETVIEDIDGAAVDGNTLYYTVRAEFDSPIYPSGNLWRGTLPELSDATQVAEDVSGTLFVQGAYLYWNATSSTVRRVDTTTFQRGGSMGQIPLAQFVAEQPDRVFYRAVDFHDSQSGVQNARVTRVVLGDAARSDVVFTGGSMVGDALEQDGHVYIAAEEANPPSLGGGLFRVTLP